MAETGTIPGERKPGDALKNGARIIALHEIGFGEAIVLALTEGMAGDPYASWRLDLATGRTYWGEYYGTFNEAVAGFHSR